MRKLKPGDYQLRIGPSDLEHAIDWYLDDIGSGYLDDISSGGWACASSRHPADPDGWVRRARQHGLIPRAVRTRDLDVRPLGWSKGAGYAPQGVRIRFRVEPRA